MGFKPNDNPKWTESMQHYDQTWHKAYCDDENPQPRIGSIRLAKIKPSGSLSEGSTVNTTTEPTPHQHVDAGLRPWAIQDHLPFALGQDVEVHAERLQEFLQLSKEDRDSIGGFFWNMFRDVMSTGSVKETYQTTMERPDAFKEILARTPPNLHSASRASLAKHELKYHKEEINKFPTIKIPVYVQLLTYP